MNVIKTDFPGLYIIEPKVFGDARGYFFESYHAKILADAGIDTVFVQDNQSFSTHGVVRGLHFQHAPFAQTKLVRVLEGDVYDVALDMRKGSPSFGKWMGVELSAANKRQFYIPQGFAHGFSVMSPQATILYKCDNFYCQQAEGGVFYGDTALNIDWKVDAAHITVSDKDAALPIFAQTENYFIYQG